MDFLNWPGCQHLSCECEKSCFKLDVEIVFSPKMSRQGYSVQLDQLHVFLVCNATGKPIKQMPLVCLTMMRVLDNDPTCNLVLIFTKDVQMNIKAKSYFERERLVSCILTMRNLAKGEQRGVASLDTLKVIRNRCFDCSHKTQAYAAVENDVLGNFSHNLTIDYEQGLIRKLSELMSSEVQTMQLDNVIDEILLNATFCYVTKVPEALVKVIMADLERCFSRYLTYEESKSDLVDMIMDKGTLPMRPEERVNFLSALDNQRASKQDNRKEESFLFKNERHLENLKILEETLEQTIRYLNLLKSLLNSRVFMQEMAN